VRCRSKAKDSATKTESTSEKPKKKTTVGRWQEEEEGEGEPQPLTALRALPKCESKYLTMFVEASVGGMLRRWLETKPKKALADVDLETFHVRRLSPVTAGPV